jgi:DNA ligase-1
MSEDGEPNFKFEVFDYVVNELERPYIDRVKDYENYLRNNPHSYVSLLKQTFICNIHELTKFEDEAVSAGHEGIMVRSLNGPYKCGRATFKSQDLIKVKRFVDSEAVITGFEEKLHNANEAEIDALGHTKRSSAKAGMRPAGTLGALLVRDIHDGREFSIGTGIGLNDELKLEIWNNQDKYINCIICYSFQRVGSKDRPRIPSFKGFRHERDMS